MVPPPDYTTPKSLPDFQRIFPNDDACIAYLFAKHFPHGFICPTCGDTQEPYRFAARPTTRRCRANQRHEVSLTANTVMHRTKVPICTWFYAAFLVTSLTPGMSALQLQKMLGIKRYETAFNMLHKLRAAMVRPGRDFTGQQHPVEVDETLVGGATQGEGRGRHHKTLVVGAVEVMARTDVKWAGRDPNVPRGQHRGGHGRGVVAGRLRFQVVPDRKQETLVPFVQANIAPGAQVRTDGWIGYAPLASLGYRHMPVAVLGDHAKTDVHLPMIHLAFSNLDAWLLGTHHGVSPQHLQAYLNEYVFRFNRRFWPMAAFDSVLGLALRRRGPTYSDLYGGEWQHPGGRAP